MNVFSPMRDEVFRDRQEAGKALAAELGRRIGERPTARFTISSRRPAKAQERGDERRPRRHGGIPPSIRELSGAARDWDPLLDLVGDARFDLGTDTHA